MQLATTIGTDDRRRQAVEFGSRALRHTATGDERFRILLDIGVAHAALRDDESLDRAAAVCAQARALPEPGGDVAQLVRLLNLEALVAYHRGFDHQAIDLEARALELAATGDPAAVDMAPRCAATWPGCSVDASATTTARRSCWRATSRVEPARTLLGHVT